jgi:hypothetical protein
MVIRNSEEERRDLELENIVGNLMIAEYQVDKLRTKLADMTTGYELTEVNKGSAYIFKHFNKWYKISVKVDEIDLDNQTDNNKFTRL